MSSINDVLRTSLLDGDGMRTRRPDLYGLRTSLGLCVPTGFHIVDISYLNFEYICEALSRPNFFHYRLSSAVLKGCMEKVKMKTFETPDEIVDMMNRDTCGR